MVCQFWFRLWLETARLHDLNPWRRHQLGTFPCYWTFVRGIHRSPMNSPHEGQWRVALMLSFICAWINGWVIIGEAGELRRRRAHYVVTVIQCWPKYPSPDGGTIPQGVDIAPVTLRYAATYHPPHTTSHEGIQRDEAAIHRKMRFHLTIAEPCISNGPMHTIT